MDVLSFRQVTQALILVVAVAVLFGGQPPEIRAQQPIGPDPKVGPEIAPALQSQTRVRVIAALADPRPLGASSTAPAEPSARRAEAASVRSSVISSLNPADFQETVQFQSVPALAGLANAAGIQMLARHPGVVKVDLDVGGTGNLAQSVPLVGGDDWHARGNRGQGVVVAVLDSGLDATHQDVNDGLIAEACFLNAGPGGKCPNGTDRQTGAGSAADDHNHGTWVTGVIASNGVHASTGMAPDAQYVAVKVLDNNNAFASTADVVAALDWVFANQPNVQVINMSLGTAARFPGNCDGATAFTMALATSINNLRTRAPTPALTVVSSGNNGDATQMQAPACISTALSVGSTTKTDTISGFSNASTTLDLLAPGDDIVTSQRAGTTNTVDGTSFSAPHVTGCAALLIRVGEAVTPAQLETRLTTSATQINDARNGQTYPRLDCTPPPPGVTVTQTVGTTAVTEGGATDTFSVVLNNRPVSNVTVSVNPGTQVTALPSPLVFTAANWNVPQDVTVAAVDDAIAEGPHSQIITMTTSSADSGYNLLVIPDINVAITENDIAGLSIGDATATEADTSTSTLTFTVTMSPQSSQVVTVQYATGTAPGPNAAAGGATCTAGVDFVTTNGTLTFLASETSKPIAVTVCPDTLTEGNETVLVNLSGAVNGTVVDGQGQGTILEDDVAGSLAFTTATAQVAENAGSVTLTVQRSGSGIAATGTVPSGSVTSGSARPNAISAVTVNYATTNGTATAGLDYTATSGTLNFGVGEMTKTIVIPILPDTIDELPEAFTATLSAPSGGATLGAITTATVTITDVDTTPCQTFLTSAVPAGSNVLPVLSQAGCNVGDTVAIDPGLPNEDRGIILGFGSIVIQQQTAQAHLAGAVVIRVTGGLPASAPPPSPGDDSADDERVERDRETEEERRQRARTNQGNKDDDAIEGDVIETRCDQAWPSVVIANRDGAVAVKLLKEAQKACSSIQAGDYLEADGEKQHEGLFHADSVEIKRRR